LLALNHLHLYNWLPIAERGRAHGVLFSGSRIGAALAFPLLVWMMAEWKWRMSFVILGAVGVVWAVYWLLWFRDHPPAPLPPEASGGGDPLSLREVFRKPAFLAAMVQYFAGNFTFFLCLSWMLPYLKKQYQLTDSQAAAYSMAPLLFGATSQWITGFLVDRLYRSRLRSWSRRLPAMIGFVLAACGVLAAGWMKEPLEAVICFTLATFGAEMTISPSWSYCADIAGKNTGSVSAAMNMVGNIGSFISANAFPYLYESTGSAVAYFSVAAALNVISVGCWSGMRSLAAHCGKEGQPALSQAS
jgi:ACS family glucarate transporter-like MFS transporter